MSNEIRFVRVGDRVINLLLMNKAEFCPATDASPATLIAHFSGEGVIALGGDEAEALWRLLKDGALRVPLEKVNAEG